jgi:hypothetical protein
MGTVAYQALVAASEQAGYPAFYKEDLTKHDRTLCESIPDSRPFAWCCRECGTHLVTVDCQAGKDWGHAVANCHKDDAKYFLWNGKELRAVTREQWLKWINSVPLVYFRCKLTVGDKESRFRPFTEYLTVTAVDRETAETVAKHEAARKWATFSNLEVLGEVKPEPAYAY